jgi:hypothetical protein
MYAQLSVPQRDERYRAAEHSLRSPLILLILFVASSCWTCDAADAPQWSDTPLTRLEALALIQTLNSEILASSSATLTLGQWCAEHNLASEPAILARRIDTAPEALSAAQRQELELGPTDQVRYRRVELSCGSHVLSIADNWYVPSRLTADMNQQLQNTQIPFGIVVRPLHPHRETLEVKMLWSPLAAGWERGGAASVQPAADEPLQLPAALFEHRAILYTPRHQAIAEVQEVYQRDILAFPQPQWPPKGQ